MIVPGYARLAIPAANASPIGISPKEPKKSRLTTRKQVVGDEFLQHRLPHRDSEADAEATQECENGRELEPGRERECGDREAVHEPERVVHETPSPARLVLAEQERAQHRAHPNIVMRNPYAPTPRPK